MWRMKVCQTINNRRHIMTFAINTENSRWLKSNEIKKKLWEWQCLYGSHVTNFSLFGNFVPFERSTGSPTKSWRGWLQVCVNTWSNEKFDKRRLSNDREPDQMWCVSLNVIRMSSLLLGILSVLFAMLVLFAQALLDRAAMLHDQSKFTRYLLMGCRYVWVY